MPSLAALNNWSNEEALTKLLECCGSKAWAQQMSLSRPFSSPEKLFLKAEEIWRRLAATDWQEAFSHHPRIGDMKAKGQAGEEQSKVKDASGETLEKLNQLNRSYEKIFGHVYLICATGKTAKEMLHLLETRIKNSPEQELRIAADEQAKITKLRLEKLLKS